MGEAGGSRFITPSDDRRAPRAVTARPAANPLGYHGLTPSSRKEGAAFPLRPESRSLRAANSMTVSGEERLARALLTHLAEPGDEFLGRLVAKEGAVGALDLVRAGDPPLARTDD